MTVEYECLSDIEKIKCLYEDIKKFRYLLKNGIQEFEIPLPEGNDIMMCLCDNAISSRKDVIRIITEKIKDRNLI